MGMKGWRFTSYINKIQRDPFEDMLKLFQELLIHTSGDVAEALSWLTQIDQEHKFTDDNYGVADFIQDLKDKGYISKDSEGKGRGGMQPTRKLEVNLRRHALDDIFDQLKKSKPGKHNTKSSGQGDEFTSELKPLEFGDKLDKISISESLKNAQINHGLDNFQLRG